MQNGTAVPPCFMVLESVVLTSFYGVCNSNSCSSYPISFTMSSTVAIIPNLNTELNHNLCYCFSDHTELTRVSTTKLIRKCSLTKIGHQF